MGTVKNSQSELDDECIFNTTSSLLLDPEDFRRQGHMVVDFLANYFHNVGNYPVRSQVEPGYLRKTLPEAAPNTPEPLENILRDVYKDILPGITHWQSPNFFAYFPCISSTPGILGEILSSGLNVVGFSWIASPAATELESIVMDWFGKLLRLPTSFLFSGGGGGVLQGTTCEAIVCTIVAARERMLGKIGRDKTGKLVVYSSDQTHSSLKKSAQIAGINPDNIRVIETTKVNLFALSPEALQSSILCDIEQGLIPLYLCATLGTTATTAVDPIRRLCETAGKHDIWVHVDGAYAGSACICPEYQHFLDGLENADSFSLNAHKWFFSTLDCCCLWVMHPTALTNALSTNPEYLRNNATENNQVVDYKDWQIALSRRFRSLKLWVIFRTYGVVNLRSFIRHAVKMAKTFQGLVSMDERFEIVVPRNFSLVCFRVSPTAIEKHLKGLQRDNEEEVNELNAKVLESINSSGKIFMTHAVVGGVYMMRFAVGAPLTQLRHVEMAWKLIQDHATSMLNTA
ncbi:PREDICTED: tyrosine decarboxylase 1-like [Ipomoea nil]|uniref:tyrosine decarboxylase 1-like n=1 Tax=Ipomoea nil TaxID=35883 RepID=UPI000900E7AA|nr:PREDICTED: tyrosine decarboxylase 1-like [Ipomoea nil]